MYKYTCSSIEYNAADYLRGCGKFSEDKLPNMYVVTQHMVICIHINEHLMIIF